MSIWKSVQSAWQKRLFLKSNDKLPSDSSDNADELNKEQRKFEVYSKSLGNHLHNANLETNNIHEL